MSILPTFKCKKCDNTFTATNDNVNAMKFAAKVVGKEEFKKIIKEDIIEISKKVFRYAKGTLEKQNKEGINRAMEIIRDHELSDEQLNEIVENHDKARE